MTRWSPPVSRSGLVVRIFARLKRRPSRPTRSSQHSAGACGSLSLTKPKHADRRQPDRSRRQHRSPSSRLARISRCRPAKWRLSSHRKTSPSRRSRSPPTARKRRRHIRQRAPALLPRARDHQIGKNKTEVVAGDHGTLHALRIRAGMVSAPPNCSAPRSKVTGRSANKPLGAVERTISRIPDRCTDLLQHAFAHADRSVRCGQSWLSFGAILSRQLRWRTLSGWLSR